MGPFLKTVLFTRDRRVFFEDDHGEIREAAPVERIEALLSLMVRRAAPHPRESEGEQLADS